MDTEKKPNEQKTDQPKQDIGEIVGDLVVSGATLLAHSAAETVVKRVKKAAAKLAPVEAVKNVAKKAKKSAAGTTVAKAKKTKKASKKSGPTNLSSSPHSCVVFPCPRLLVSYGNNSPGRSGAERHRGRPQ